MSGSVLQAVDFETRSVVLFSMNDPDGDDSADYGHVTTELLADPDWGAPRRDIQRFDPPNRDGMRTVYNKAVDAEATMRIRIKAPDYDSLTLAVGRLSYLISHGHPLRWIAEGSALTKYAIIEPSQTPALLHGQPVGLFEVLRLFDTPQGVELKLSRQPFFDGDVLDSADVFPLANSSLLLDLTADTEPDYWAWDDDSQITSASVDPDAEAFVFTVTGTVEQSLTQTTNPASVSATSTYALAFDARVASGTNMGADATLQFYDSGDAPVGSLNEGTLVGLTTDWQRVYVTGLAGTDSDYAALGLRFTATSGAAVQVHIRNVQFEEAAAPTLYRPATEPGIASDPADYSGCSHPFFAQGDADTPVEVYVKSATDEEEHLWLGWQGRDYPGQGAITNWLNGGKFTQFEGGTNGTDTANRTDAGASPQTGVSAKRTTFSTITMSPRITATETNAAHLASLQGRSWLLLLRCLPKATYTFTVRLDVGWGTGGYSIPASATTATILGAAGDPWMWLPCGIVEFPDDLSAGLTIVGNAAGPSTRTFDWDLVAYVPASACDIDLGQEIATTGFTFHTDPSSPGVNVLNASGKVALSAGVTQKGGVPFVARPGLNGLFAAVSESSDGTRGAHDITQFHDIGYRYRPRYHA